MGPKMKGLYKAGFKYITSIFVVKERELEIGCPTDVKHVAHIGWEGSSGTAPTWMKGFKTGPEFAATTIGNNGSSLSPWSTQVTLFASTMSQLDNNDVEVSEEQEILDTELTTARTSGPILSASASRLISDHPDDDDIRPPLATVQEVGVVEIPDDNGNRSDSSYTREAKRKVKKIARKADEVERSSKKKRPNPPQVALLYPDLLQGENGYDPMLVKSMGSRELIDTGENVVADVLRLVGTSTALSEETITRVHASLSYQEKLEKEVVVLNGKLEGFEEAKQKEVDELSKDHQAELQKQSLQHQKNLQDEMDGHLDDRTALKNQISRLRDEKAELIRDHHVQIKAVVDQAIGSFKASEELESTFSILLSSALKSGYCIGVDETKAQCPNFDLNRLPTKGWYKTGWDKVINTRYEEFKRGIDIAKRYAPKAKSKAPEKPAEAKAHVPSVEKVVTPISDELQVEMTVSGSFRVEDGFQSSKDQAAGHEPSSI